MTECSSENGGVAVSSRARPWRVLVSRQASASGEVRSGDRGRIEEGKAGSSRTWAGAEAQHDEDDDVVRAHGQSRAWAMTGAKCTSLTHRREDLAKILALCPVQDIFPTSQSPTHIKGP